MKNLRFGLRNQRALFLTLFPVFPDRILLTVKMIPLLYFLFDRTFMSNIPHLHLQNLGEREPLLCLYISLIFLVYAFRLFLTLRGPSLFLRTRSPQCKRKFDFFCPLTKNLFGDFFKDPGVS